MAAAVDNVVLAVHLVALCYGGAVAAIAFNRADLHSRRYLFFMALSVASASVMILSDTLAFYNRVADTVLGEAALPLSAALAFAGAGVNSWAQAGFIFTVAGLSRWRPRFVVQALLSVSFAAAGAGSWLISEPLRGVPVGLGLAALNVILTVILLANWDRIERPEIRPFLLRLCVIVGFTVAGAVLQLVLELRFPVLPLDKLHVVQLLSYLAVVAALHHHLLVEMPRESGPIEGVPPVFVARYGISPREAEIVALVLQGYRNREIGNHLFISDRTVKNHIYSIYQKTGASTKVQLSNLVRSVREPA